MDDRAFQQKFTELMGRISELPEGDRARLQQLAEETRQRRERLAASIGELQESLDHLRLTVKYLVFDLEATRRENTYLRRMLEQSNRDPNRKNTDRRREKKNGGDDVNFLDEGDRK
jgi:regulator of replication initiation timing